MSKFTPTPPLTPVEAQRRVHDGSAVVAIPYTAYMQPDETVRLSTYTEMTTHAAAVLYNTSHARDTKVVAVGEHTYGERHVSTTDLMYADLLRHGVPVSAYATARPVCADATPQQIAWLVETFGKTWQGHAPVLVGHGTHWPRMERLCNLYGLSATFVDAVTVLESAGALTPAYRHAAALYETEGAGYEDRVHRLTAMTAWLGPAAMTALFRALVWLRSPNVVEVGSTEDEHGLYAVTARQHARNIRR